MASLSSDARVLNFIETSSPAVFRDHLSHRGSMAHATLFDLCKCQCLNESKCSDFWNDPFSDNQRCILEPIDHEQRAGGYAYTHTYVYIYSHTYTYKHTCTYAEAYADTYPHRHAKGFQPLEPLQAGGLR